MKKSTTLLIVAVCLAVWFCLAGPGKAQDKTATAARYEYGMIKWDGPDRLQFITPEKTESLRAFKSGVQLPPDAHDEEYCVVWAVNRMAKEGGEVVTLHSTRVMIRCAL